MNGATGLLQTAIGEQGVATGAVECVCRGMLLRMVEEVGGRKRTERKGRVREGSATEV